MILSPQTLLARMPRTFAWLLSRRQVRNMDKEVLLRVIRRGMRIHDIGANEGYYTQLFSDVVGPRGHVDACEPIPATCARLRTSTAGRTNVTVHECAIGDRLDTVTLTVPNHDFEQASLATHDVGSWTTGNARVQFRVSMSTVDALVEAGTVQVPDLMKIDVEGAEQLVVAGAMQTLSRHRPILFLEAFPDWTRQFGYAPLDLIRSIANLGYRDLFVVTGTGVHRLPEVSAVTTWPFTEGVDVLCLPPTPEGRECIPHLSSLLAPSRDVTAGEAEP